ncbi:thiamine pyrophosphate-requiring protein [Rothia sp. AR01]|uniref:Thiamine pyrophosphate-requiring protein n=1 Tax=Rothia santali TaxID=2949643 RepID=A0A9X2KHU5_9MICC|nr:thiamine pyrophosphate-requiring protein [Rothia santali]MCP3426217.1 thiamine pyrophosphate-requiring protein [Rothia santali]
MLTSDLIVRRLSEWGVTRIFGYSGDGNNALMGALQRAGTPEFVQARHEESAAFMAVGHAKYGGGVGVVTATQGPGAIHLLNGLYDAKSDSAPVVAIVGQQQTDTLGSGYQQEVDLHTLFQDVAVGFAQQLASPTQVPLAIDRAFRQALAHRGPAVVIVPQDVQEAEAAEPGQEHGHMPSSPVSTAPEVRPAEADLDRAAEALSPSRRLTILVGQGAANAWPQVEALAERRGAAVAASLLGKPHVDERAPYVAGTMGHLGTPESAVVLQECDALLIVGSDDPWTEYYPPPGSVPAVQIDIDPVKLGNRHPVDVGIAGDAAASLEGLLARLPEAEDRGWRERTVQAVDAGRRVAEARAAVEAAPGRVNPEAVFHEWNGRLDDDALVALDVGSSVYWYARQLRRGPVGGAHLSSTLASMGCSVPYGIAAKLLHPGRPLVAFTGDGALQMLGINELITVSRLWPGWEDPRFVLVVLTNGDLAEVSWEQREMEGQPRFDRSQDLPGFDAAAYARQLGLAGLTVTHPAQLGGAIEEALAAGRPAVVDVRTDPQIPLLPPLYQDRAKLEGIREAIGREDAERRSHALHLLDQYAGIELRLLGLEDDA